MTKIHMITENLDQLYDYINKWLTSTREIIAIFKKDADVLPDYWSGGMAEQVEEKFSDTAGRMDDIANKVETLNQRMWREMDEWLLADELGQRKFTGSGVSILGKPPQAAPPKETELVYYKEKKDGGFLGLVKKIPGGDTLVEGGKYLYGKGKDALSALDENVLKPFEENILEPYGKYLVVGGTVVAIASGALPAGVLLDAAASAVIGQVVEPVVDKIKDRGKELVDGVLDPYLDPIKEYADRKLDPIKKSLGEVKAGLIDPLNDKFVQPIKGALDKAKIASDIARNGLPLDKLLEAQVAEVIGKVK